MFGDGFTRTNLVMEPPFVSAYLSENGILDYHVNFEAVFQVVIAFENGSCAGEEKRKSDPQREFVKALGFCFDAQFSCITH